MNGSPVTHPAPASPAPAPVSNPLLAAALSYAARGWHVLPLHTPDAAGACSCIKGPDCGRDTGKHPRTLKGLNDAATDEATIRKWWAWWPDANIGIRTGTVSGLVAVDLDGPDGMESWIALQREYEDAGPTLTTRTSRGNHLLFQHPGGEVKSRVALRKALDVRGDGGYIVAPPSRHASGVAYKWECGPEVIEAESLPPGLLKALAEPAPGSGNGSKPPLDTAAILAGVPEGEREDKIFRLACKLRGADIPQGMAERLCVEAAEKAEQPPGRPFTPEEAREKVTRAYRKYPAGTGLPGPIPVIGAANSREDSPVESWPDPVADAAYHGILGEIVQAIAPHTEADPVAVLAQLLVGFGNLIGGGPFYRVEGTQHRCNEFLVLVGRTAGGRKGTAWDQARRILQDIDAAWARDRIQGGLASGEGLIHAIRDRREESRPVMDKGRVTGYQPVETDAGIADKRLMDYEPEFARILKVMTREGSTLSTIVRQAWDSPSLRVMAKTAGAIATGAHVSIVAHVTGEELIRQLQETEAASGFGNRFLWIAVKRARLLPDGSDLDAGELAPLLARLQDAATFAREVGEVIRDTEARALWRREYAALTAERPGLLGAMLSRAAPHVVRLSMLYALADSSASIRRPHLEAALALWDYAARSAAFIFGDSLGDPTADELLRALRNAGAAGMTRNDIREHFSKNKTASETDRALQVLARQSLAACTREETGGRPAERWKAVLPGGE